jgi:hypothetical protein
MLYVVNGRERRVFRWLVDWTKMRSNMFGRHRVVSDEVTWEWRKLHNEEINDLYSLPNIVLVVKSRRMRCAGHVTSMGGGGVRRVLVGKHKETRPLGRPRRRW